jgi:hypothetical protein
MRIVGVEPLTEAEELALRRPVKTERWFDHHNTRCWVVMTLNAAGDQIGDATYVHRKEDAIRDQKFREEDIANWVDPETKES